MSLKIKKLIFYPKRRGDAPIWQQGAYMPISVNNNRIANQDSLKEILELIFNNCDSFTAVLGGYLHRHNLQMLIGLPEEQAKSKGLEIEESLIQHVSKVASELNKSKNIRFVPSSKFYHYNEFKPRFEELLSIYHVHKGFFRIMEDTVDSFLLRNITNLSISEIKSRELCKNYLLEEIVIFELLAKEGYKLNIYPGQQLPVIKEIVNGTLKGISTILESISLIEIKFKPNN